MEEFEVVAKGGLLYNIGRVSLRAEGVHSDSNFVDKSLAWIERNLKDDASASKVKEYLRDKKEIFHLWESSHNLVCQRKDIKTVYNEPFVSPFYKIRNPNNLDDSIDRIPYYQLLPEEIPIARFDKPVINQESYKALIDNFEMDLKLTTPPYSINLLLMLMEKYLSNIPLGGVFSDVSLFKHSLTVSAVSVCLYHYVKGRYGNNWKNYLNSETLQGILKEKPFLLIGGDTSGIQKFIYTISSKGALRSLKGRSFYIELLTEHVVSELIDILNLTRCNIVFSAAGNFCIFSPNTKEALDRIDKLKNRIQSFLFSEFSGELQLHLEYVSFGEDEIENSSLVFDALGEKLEKSKRRTWVNRLQEILQPKNPDKSCLTTQCEVCFREDCSLVSLQRDDEIIKVCEPCFFQYKLGEELLEISEGNAPVIYRVSAKPACDYIKIENAFYIFRRNRDEKLESSAIKIYRINDLRAKNYKNVNNIFLPLAIYKKSHLKELKDAVNDFGINRLAVLRMDVDNLGKIFNSAIEERERTFTRRSEISSRLNKFFKYYLNFIVEGKKFACCDILERGVKKRGRNLMIVYAGGDDVFIIGHWLDAIEVAVDIKKYFELFTGNKFLTISAGVAINHEDYPVYQYANDSEKLEQLAKKGTKDSIALLDSRKMSWDTLQKVFERLKFFKRFLNSKSDHLSADEEKLPKTFFYRLFHLAKRFREEGILVLPRAGYLISRAKFKNCVPEDIARMKEFIMNVNEKEWEITELATLLTLMLMRKGGK
ncbi:type III-A CRISPR-associated protein Cas10/Csm1 [Thermodesulfovibrio sp. TK110]